MGYTTRATRAASYTTMEPSQNISAPGSGPPTLTFPLDGIIVKCVVRNPWNLFHISNEPYSVVVHVTLSPTTLSTVAE